MRVVYVHLVEEPVNLMKFRVASLTKFSRGEHTIVEENWSLVQLLFLRGIKKKKKRFLCGSSQTRQSYLG